MLESSLFTVFSFCDRIVHTRSSGFGHDMPELGKDLAVDIQGLLRVLASTKCINSNTTATLSCLQMHSHSFS